MGRAKRLTSDAVRRLAASAGTKTYSDPTLPGLYLRVNRRSKTWIAQRQAGGVQRRVTLGRFPEVSAEAAREKALKALAAMGEGRNPAEERRRALARGMTLQEALDAHLRSARLSERTKAGYRYHVETHLEKWLRRPLRDIGQDRAGVRAEHERIAGKARARTADLTMQVLRAVYNRALREQPDLPPNPCVAVDFQPLRRRKVDLGAERLKAWGRAVLELPPVRRDLHLFILLTAMRRTAACEARAEHVDLEAGVLHVPRPKGGEERAFDVPLSAPLVDLLRHRLQENQAIKRRTPWLFPSLTSKTGHVTETKEPALGGLHGHALRHAYRTLCEDAGVSWAHGKLLLNQTVSDVSFGYMQRRLEALRESQERASAFILATVGLEWRAGEWPPVRTR